MFESDFVLRAARQIAQALLRIMGKRDLGQEEEADRELDELYRGLVPFDRELLDLLDVQTLATMIGDPEKVRAICQLLAFEAERAAERDQPERALRIRRRALALLAAGVPNPDADAQAVEAALRERLAAESER